MAAADSAADVAQPANEDNMDHTIKELTPFLINTNPRLRAVAVQNMFALTGHDEYLPLLRSNMDASEAFVKVVRGEIVPQIKQDAYSALINLSGDPFTAEALTDNPDNLLIPELVTEILDSKSEFADKACIVLANLTRNTEHAVVRVLKMRSQALNPAFDAKAIPEPEEEVEGEAIYALLKEFMNEKYNEKKQTLHWLGSVFANVTQNPLGRKVVLNRKQFAFQRLLSMIGHHEIIRRGGVIAMIRNCAFDESIHEWLLGDEVDILPYILLPLAGPEELSEEDMEGMPDDLQYLPEDKLREPDPKLRLMLIETLTQLCATRYGRDVCRQKKVYPILRELHKWEKVEDLEKPIYDLVNIVMGDEDASVDNLKTVVIPPTVKDNADYIRIMEEAAKRKSDFENSQYHEKVVIAPAVWLYSCIGGLVEYAPTDVVETAYRVNL